MLVRAAGVEISEFVNSDRSGTKHTYRKATQIPDWPRLNAR